MVRQEPMIPPLPAAWPYEPRRSSSSLGCRDNADLPSLGGGWTLLAAEGLELAGEAAPLGGAFGRGGVRRAGGAVLRPYRRGGLLRHLNERAYASPERFRAELEVHRALWAAGFPTVEPLGCAWRRRGLGVEGVYLTRFAPAKPWPSDWTATAALLPPLRQALRALADWGLWAPDLNATNVLRGEDGGLLLLDWDRARWVSGPLLPRYHARLVRSLRKLGAPAEAMKVLS